MTHQIKSPLFKTKKSKTDPQWRDRQEQAIATLDGALNKIEEAQGKRHEYLELAQREMARVRAEKEAIADATQHFLIDVMLMAENGDDEVDGGFKRAVERLQWKIASYLDPKRF